MHRALGYLVEGGLVAVQGPGLTVRLNDAPADSPRRDDVSPDVLVVHQQDIQAVMNALWAGGAEAMEIMDQRIISTSAIHCAGNVLRLHGRIYSPPYNIRAIGDPDRLRHALSASSAVQSYVRDAGDVGLGWSVSDVEHVVAARAAPRTRARRTCRRPRSPRAPRSCRVSTRPSRVSATGRAAHAHGRRRLREPHAERGASARSV